MIICQQNDFETLSLGRLTPRLKYRVSPIDPKYVAVKGKRGADIRCWRYVHGPIIAPQDAKNNTEPSDHLVCHMHIVSFNQL